MSAQRESLRFFLKVKTVFADKSVGADVAFHADSTRSRHNQVRGFPSRTVRTRLKSSPAFSQNQKQSGSPAMLPILM